MEYVPKCSNRPQFCDVPVFVLVVAFSATFMATMFIIKAYDFQTSGVSSIEVVSSKEDQLEKAVDMLARSSEEMERKIGRLRFSRRPETAHVECDRAIQDDKEHLEKISKNRSTLLVQDNNMTCAELRRKILPPVKLRPLKFGVAYARVVYESYEFIVDELRSSYHLQNFFCYSVDKKADENFNRRVNALQECFSNVVVTKARFNVDSAGHFMNHAYYECFKLLIRKPGWGYVLLMQNYDVIIKTVYETVAILEKLEGANDVHIRPSEDHRWNHSAKWDAQSLRLYRNEALATPAQLNGTLTIARGAVQASMSRAAVDWMVNTVDLTVLLNQLNTNAYGTDEVLMASLQASDIFDMPGRFTGECLRRNNMTASITRIEIWSHQLEKCHSRKFRHKVCIFGIEDFYWLSRHPNILANKMMPQFDYSIVDCMHELIFNRTHLGQANEALNLTIYENQPSVLYHKNRLRPDPDYKLDCSFGK